MEDDQIQVLANQLKGLLLARKKALEQLLHLGNLIIALSEQFFGSYSTLSTTSRLHLARLSVAMGVNRVYRHYQKRNFRDIVEISGRITSLLDPTDAADLGDSLLPPPIRDFGESRDTYSTHETNFCVFTMRSE